MSEITEYVDNFTNPESLEEKNDDELESSMAEGDSCCLSDEEIKCPCDVNGYDADDENRTDNEDEAQDEALKKKSFACRWFGLGC